jgi:hypothetical protein
MRGVWPTYSKDEFTHVSCFMLALLLTSRTEDEFQGTLSVIQIWRYVLNTHVKMNEALLATALAKLDSYWSKGSEALLEMVR